MTHGSSPQFHLASPWNVALGSLLGQLRFGELTVALPDGAEHRFTGAEPGPVARMDVRRGSVARRIALGGDIGLAETYLDGSWDTPDLKAVLDLGLGNMSAGWIADVPIAFKPIARAWHAMRDNSPSGGSKRNIAYHYDLGNAFYELWLDDSMTYSAACYDEPSEQAAPVEALESAQRHKWDRILDIIQPGRGDHLLEIGCGWGGFALHAAKEAGCRITGLTLSEEQAELARRRVAEEGLDGQIDIRLQDYREVAGEYAGVASIEMFEAVGERWWPVFFSRVRELLRPGGVAGLQVITIEDGRYEDYRANPDFIQRYIFPGGMLPSPERFARAAKDANLTPCPPHFFGLDYARTLAAWSERFEAAVPQVRGLGFDERFVRMWRYYLQYCRTGFEHGAIDVMHVRLER
jgi:cyclopropane-fatty-acyl-phospholipid synthase